MRGLNFLLIGMNIEIYIRVLSLKNTGMVALEQGIGEGLIVFDFWKYDDNL